MDVNDPGSGAADVTDPDFSNEALVEAMRNVSIEDSPQRSPMLYQLMLESTLIVATAGQPDDSNSTETGDSKATTHDAATAGEPNRSLQLQGGTDEDGTWVPVFTSLSRLQRWEPTGGTWTAMAGRPLFEMLERAEPPRSSSIRPPTSGASSLATPWRPWPGVTFRPGCPRSSSTRPAGVSRSRSDSCPSTGSTPCELQWTAAPERHPGLHHADERRRPSGPARHHPVLCRHASCGDGRTGASVWSPPTPADAVPTCATGRSSARTRTSRRGSVTEPEQSSSAVSPTVRRRSAAAAASGLDAERQAEQRKEVLGVEEEAEFADPVARDLDDLQRPGCPTTVRARAVLAERR